MNIPTSLASAAMTLAVIGILGTLRSLFVTIKAERSWVRALREPQRQLLRDLLEEENLAFGSQRARALWQRRYLAESVADLLQELEEQRAIPERDRRRIEGALRQPSEEGRRNYARKLAEEGVRHELIA